MAPRPWLRWTHPTLGQVSPGRLIPLAEEIGLISRLGAWVLEQACLQVAAWDARGLIVPRVAVNLLVQQIERADIVDEVVSILRRTGVEPDRLELEITESMLMRNAEQVLDNLVKLRKPGITLAVDDFGSGFSSLAYRKRLPIHRLKLDKALVDNLTINPRDDAIARAVIAVGRGLGLFVLAEGVETEDQARFLHAEGCDEIQGYLYARPMAASDLVAASSARGWIWPQ